MEQKEDAQFVKWFSELNKDSGNVVGGKGANLAEIFNLNLPVPPGFVVTAQAYDYFIEKAGIKEKIFEILSQINYEDTAQLDESTKQIRELIAESEMPEEMQSEILEAYGHLGAKPSKKAESEVIGTESEQVFVAVRSSATTEDLADASFAGQQDTYLNVIGTENLIQSVKNCFASLFTSRATYYRNKKGFKHEQSSLAVIVQKMIDSYKSGVIFSKDPAHKNENTIIEAVFGLGEGIVSGKINPDKYVVSPEIDILDKKISNKKIAITKDEQGQKEIVKLSDEKSKSQVLSNYEIGKLAEYALTLEKHYQKPQDIEFAIENEQIFIVQTRPITTMEQRVDVKEIQGELILSGIPASPGIAFGKIKIIDKLEDLPKVQKGDVLVTKMTNPDMVVTMQKSIAIVTDDGGMTSHAAIVSREMGIPAVVGTETATEKLKEGEIITINGFTGKIYKGKVSENVQKQVLPVVETQTEIKVIVDLPSFAERAAKANVRAVGLTRLEGIIAESGKHPNYFLQNKNMQDYEEIIYQGIQGIAEYFDEIWVRTSDIRSDEYANLEGAPKEIEVNPMLGMHGIRRGLKNIEVLKSELNALKKIAQGNKKIGLILPQVISVEEVQAVKKVLGEVGFSDAKVGVMVETPASVQIIQELCEEGIEFISFGTNDLTQYTLAIDRGNSEVQYLHNEMHPAILHQLEYVIKVCKQYKVQTSICGQAGSKKEMAKFLVEQGIDSISVNADMAQEISKYVRELEGGKVDENSEADASEVDEGDNVESNEVEVKEEVVEQPVEEIKTELPEVEKEVVEEEVKEPAPEKKEEAPIETEKPKEETIPETKEEKKLDKEIEKIKEEIKEVDSEDRLDIF